MSTHDYNLANQSGASFRSDLNNCLAAILSNNSNASSPSTTVAYMLWADTNSATLKIRNSANDDWVELFQLDGTLTLEDGSASTPALAFRDDLNTGIFSSAADTFNIATAGVERFELKASETVFNEDGADTDFRVESDTNANFFKIDAGSEQASFGGAVTASGYTLEVIRSTTEAYANATDSTLRLNNTNTSANDNQASLHFSVSTTSTGADAAIVAQAEDSSGNSRLEFYTDDANVLAEKMVIDSSGQVGIGVSSPADNLHLAESGATNSLIRFSNSNVSNGWSVGAHSAGRFQITQNGVADRLVVASSGEVGIGTTSPAEDLHISADTPVLRLTDSSTDRHAQFVCTDGSLRIDADNDNAQSNTNISFRTDGTERMRLDDTGLGIGTTSPNYKLVVQGSGVQTILAGSTNAAGATLILDGDSNGDGSGSDYASITHNSAGNIEINNRKSAAIIFKNTSSETERMRLDEFGFLGLGADSPAGFSSAARNLVVSTNSGNCGLTINTGAADQVGSIFFAEGTSASGKGRIRYEHANNAMAFSTDDNERMRMDSNGIMLINGTSTFDSVSSAKLQIKGDAAAGLAVTGNSTSSQSRISFFNPNGRVGVIVTADSATTYGTSSDYRLKENATAISDGITRIKTLKPYRFNFKSDATKTLDGFFAHEVTAVPEAIVGTKDEVDSDNNPIYQVIDQSKLVPLLVAAVQEAIKKIETLETKVAALEAA